MDKRLLSRLPRIALAAAGMGLFLYFAAPLGTPYLEGRILVDYTLLLLVCGAGFLIYAAVAALLRAFDMSDIRDALKRS